MAATVPGTRRTFGDAVEYELVDAPEYRYNTRSGKYHTPDCPHGTEIYKTLSPDETARRWRRTPDVPAEERPTMQWCNTCAARKVSAGGVVGDTVREGLIQRTVLDVLRDAGRPLRGSDVLDAVAERHQFTEYELAALDSNGSPRWRTHTLFGTANMVVAGWLTKNSGEWAITAAGVEALDSLGPDVARVAAAKWRERNRTQRLRAKTGGPQADIVDAVIEVLDDGQWSTFAEVGELASLPSAVIKEYVASLPEDSGTHRLLEAADGTGTEARALLEAEGLQFDEHGHADEHAHVRKEDLRERLDELGLLPKVPRRAWLVRTGSANSDPPNRHSRVSLAAPKLREVPEGISRDDLKAIVDEDYSHLSYSARSDKLDALHFFLTRMQVGDIVATADQEQLYVGTVSGHVQRGPADQTLAQYIAAAHPDQAQPADDTLIRTVEWAAIGGVGYAALPGELTARLGVRKDVLDLTQQLDVLEALMSSQTEQVLPPQVAKVVLRDASGDLSTSLHVSRTWLQECIDLLNDRPQLIFYGPPGTGKTFIAQALAKHVAGENVRLVQFHPTYSYEDFFEGFRPNETGGFALKPGPMRKIVDQALENTTVPHVLVIDEINRGNLAKVFGELYFMLEYRDSNVELLYTDDDFSLPENVYIIGTMNTADRSIALVDTAMRRRFAFMALHPTMPPTNGVLRSWLDAQGKPSRVADLLDELNRRIEDPDFKIGPSYFMRQAVYAEGGLERTWRTAILPLLEEHHFGEMTSHEVGERYGLNAVTAAVDRLGTPDGLTEDGTDASPAAD